MRRFIDSSRLSRARKITERSVLEFKIVQEDPVITYCYLQGSASDPYICFIDLKDNKVGHSCPDFDKSNRYNNQRNQIAGWCKHLGKLLLLLDSNLLNPIAEQLAISSI